jgi:xanthosine utilization system XapX-like protein
VKRGFLFGLGSFLIVGAIIAFIHAATGDSPVGFVIVGLILMPLSVKVIQWAKSAPSTKSWFYAIAGWMIGFFVFDAAAVAIVGGVLLWQSGWNPFLPKDYEECIESAAKSAKSKEALDILVSSCGSKFVGRRNGRGGYAYYDSRQNRSFNITGPNPTAGEWTTIENAYNQYLADAAREKEIQRLKLAEQQRQQYEEFQRAQNAQAEQVLKLQQAQAEQQRRQQQAQAALDMRRQVAAKRVEVTNSSIECNYGPYTCGTYKLTVMIKNQSTENIAAMSLGWAFVSLQEQNCPDSLPTKQQEKITLRPGNTTVVNIDGYDGPPSTPVRYCIKVTDVEISLNQ